MKKNEVYAGGKARYNQDELLRPDIGWYRF